VLFYLKKKTILATVKKTRETLSSCCLTMMLLVIYMVFGRKTAEQITCVSCLSLIVSVFLDKFSVPCSVFSLAVLETCGLEFRGSRNKF
jgi:hypothetical protein